jgi:hypothetical protein
MVSTCCPLHPTDSETRVRPVGGCGVKLHPDYKYRNLYGWLFGDTHFWKGNNGHPLPLEGRPYRFGDRDL